jgi:hypothetical protein
MSTSSEVFDKIIVGQVDTSFLDITTRLISGVSVMNGPVYIGSVVSAGTPRATCMIAPGLFPTPYTLEVTGVNNFLAATNQWGLLAVNGASIFNGANTINGVTVFNGNITVNASQVINGPLVVNGSTNINGFLTFSSSIVGVTKDFDIPHPTKKNHRLKHGCLEGPEYSVFYRGRLKNENVIQLPDYWRGLVDLDTITVNFTPHTYYQELYVKSIDWGTKITVVNNSGGQIDCSYIVFAERKDIKKLVPEYEGLEPKQNCDIEV